MQCIHETSISAEYFYIPMFWMGASIPLAASAYNTAWIYIGHISSILFDRDIDV